MCCTSTVKSAVAPVATILIVFSFGDNVIVWQIKWMRPRKARRPTLRLEEILPTGEALHEKADTQASSEFTHSIRNPFPLVPLGERRAKKEAVSETKTVSALKLLTCRPTLEAFGRKSDNRRGLRWCGRLHWQKGVSALPLKADMCSATRGMSALCQKRTCNNALARYSSLCDIYHIC